MNRGRLCGWYSVQKRPSCNLTRAIDHIHERCYLIAYSFQTAPVLEVSDSNTVHAETKCSLSWPVPTISARSAAQSLKKNIERNRSPEPTTRGPPKPRNGGRPPLKAEKRVLDEVGRLYRAAGRGIGLGGGCVSWVCGVFVGHVLWRYRVYL
jgi:hypothetical protein